MDETKLSPSARRALEVFEAQTAAPLAPARRDALWRSAVASQRPAGSPWALQAVLLCLSCAVGAIAVTQLMRGLRGPEVQAAASAQWHRDGASLTLERGQLRLRPRVKLAVATPHLQAVVQNAVVLFDVSAGGTLLSVESGEVAWRAALEGGVLRAGEQLRVAAAAKLTIVPGVPAVEGCSPGADFEKCLAREAEGSGLAAETALYALGMVAHERGELAEAARLFRTYGERFATGVFSPEASIALMVDLQQQGSFAEARAEAGRFSSRFADEPRAEEVARWAEQLP